MIERPSKDCQGMYRLQNVYGRTEWYHSRPRAYCRKKMLRNIATQFLVTLCLLVGVMPLPAQIVRKPTPQKGGGIVAPRPSVPRTVLQQEVCPDPKAPCNTAAKKFAPYEISFRLPGKLTRGKTYESLPFYAVLIKTYAEESCDADDHTESIERERLKLQIAYPRNKVFASYSCPNLDAVDYSFPGKMDSEGERVLIMTFIAVYAGQTQAQANEFLSYVRTVYPSASLKHMKASYEILDQ
jgi:hypothetical protein